MASVLRNFTTLVSGTTFSQVVPFVVAPIISRIYSPEEFADFTLFTSVLSIVVLISTFKYEMAIILPKSENESQHLTTMSILLSFVIGIVSFIVITLINLFLKINSYFFLIPLASFLFSFTIIYDRVYNRKSAYVSMSMMRITKSTVESGYNLLGICSFFKDWNLIFGQVLGYFFSSLIIWFKEGKNIVIGLKNISMRKNIWLIQKYSNFPKFVLPHALLNSVSTNLPVLLIPIYFSSHELGLYSFGLKYVQAPVSILSGALYNIITQDLTSLIGDKLALKSRFSFYLKYLLGGAVLLIFILLVAPYIFTFVFGDKWKVAGEYVALLSFWLSLSFVLSALASLPLIFNKQKLAFYIEIAYSIVKVLPFIICGGFLKLNIETTLIVYTALCSLLLLFTLKWYSKIITIS